MPTRVDCLEETTVTLFLDRKLAEDRASAVESHIDGCDSCRRLLSELARGRADTKPGDGVDRYVLLRAIGSGGMGTVYAAYDPVLDRKIAIKLLRTGAGDPERRARLIREAQAMAKVSSRNVVAVYDAGAAGEQVYVAMELVGGGTLRSWLRERPRSWREIVRVFEGAGRGLAAAHDTGVVHRDFKPDNVLVDGDRVCVADFGLAAPIASPGELANATTALDHSLTITGAVVGTPAYMSPEQLAGKPIDGKGDQFSFCVALYEALYGGRPFAGDTLAELTAELEAGRVRAPGKSGPSWLASTVMRGLAPDPAARHASMSALLGKLSRHRSRRALWITAGVVALAGIAIVWKLAAGGETTCRFGDRFDGIWDAPRRHALETAFAATKTRTAAAAAAETAGALDAYTTGWIAMRTEACEATARGEQSDQLLDLRMQCLDRRRGELAALVDDLAAADAGVVAKAVTAVHALAPVADCADLAAVMARVRPPATFPERTAVDQLRNELAAAKALRLTGRYRDALARATPLVPAARAIGYEPLVAETLLERAESEVKMERIAASVATFEEAARTAYAANDDDTAARAWISLVYAAGSTKIDARTAEQALAMGRAALQRMPGHDAWRVELLTYEGSFRYAEGNYDLARDRHTEALGLGEKVLPRDDDRIATIRNNLAVDEVARGNLDTAEKLYREVIAQRERKLGADDPHIAETRSNLANVLSQRKRYAEALAELDRAAASVERTLGADHPDVAIFLINSCDALQNLGRLDEAISRARRALAIFEKVGADDPRTTASLTLVAKLVAAKGDPDAAIPMFERALALQEKRLGRDHPAIASTLNNLAEVQAARKNYPAAIAAYERALAIVESKLGPKHRRVTYSLVGLGAAYAATGARAKAIAALDRAIPLLEGPNGDPEGLAEARKIRDGLQLR
jgi:tetratricopeptide (TPR) repeat protein